MLITYDSIKPLIVKEELVGSQLNVSFQSEGMSAPIQAVGMMTVDQAEMMKNVQKQAVKQSVISTIISTIGRVLSGMIGGVGGSVAHTATSTIGHSVVGNQMNAQNMMNAPDTPENRQKAAVTAFQTVQNYFEYDPTSGTWKGKPPVAN